MKILSLDLGLHCGWAVVNHKNPKIENIEQHFIWGTWNLKGDRFEGAGFRFLRFRKYLNEIGSNTNLVFYEEVRGHLGVDAAHSYGGLLAVLQSWCEENKIPYRGIPVGTVKKFATGKGNSNKEAMINAAKQIWFSGKFSLGISNDNEADALFILAYSCFNLLP